MKLPQLSYKKVAGAIVVNFMKSILRAISAVDCADENVTKCHIGGEVASHPAKTKFLLIMNFYGTLIYIKGD